MIERWASIGTLYVRTPLKGGRTVPYIQRTARPGPYRTRTVHPHIVLLASKNGLLDHNSSGMTELTPKISNLYPEIRHPAATRRGSTQTAAADTARCRPISAPAVRRAKRYIVTRSPTKIVPTNNDTTPDRPHLAGGE